MYFLVSGLNGWGKRSAAQPQTVYSEFPLEKNVPTYVGTFLKSRDYSSKTRWSTPEDWNSDM